jgi:hypothetical protein
MKRLLTVSLSALALCAALGTSTAAAEEGFGLKDFDVTFTTAGGSTDLRAGAHPFAWTTSFAVNTKIDPKIGEVPIDAIRDLEIEMPAGLVGDPKATPRCSAVDFADVNAGEPACSDSTVVGITTVVVGLSAKNGGIETFTLPVYNLEPPPGAPAKFGFIALTVPVTLEAKINPNPPYNLFASLTHIAQPIRFYGSEFTVWGTPASPAHDIDRGHCAGPGPELCSASIPQRPFLTLPRRCEGPLPFSFEVDSWQDPGNWLPPYVALTHDDSVPPQPLGTIDCASLGFAPRISSQPTTDQVESPTGLDFHLNIDDEGLTNPEGRAQSDIKKAVVTLPEGVTANPSAAAGLLTCSEADLARETVDSEAGEGCPQASKVGTVEVETPLLEGELITGQVFIATQNENPFDSLLALYMVIKHPGLGILVKLPGKVEPDPRTGQLITTFGEAPYELPQFPFSDFRFHFREGGRSLLITPPGCGIYETKAVFTPWANPSNPLTTTSSFQITRGAGGACPPAGPPPFAPGFEAGSLNNDAGHYSPFYMRFTRRDGDQDLTRFDATLPAGMVAKLAGVSQCPDTAIAAAKAKSGRAELASPSCPATSQIGSVVGGAGVGSQLTYVEGKVYLAGPFGGAPLSAVGVVPAVAGPFDVGTVVVREALQVNPRTGEVRVDGAHSDPIPHILAGIPLKVRDIRVFVDRPEFTLNPTSCEPMEVSAQVWGGGSNPFAVTDDAPLSLAERFQAANCANLGFKPRFTLRLRGGMKRGDNPKLRAVFKPRRGDANLSDLLLRLPRSAFLDQAHIRTICTRVQYAAKKCPAGAIYGHVRAFTPILAEPLEGPIYLRSSNHNLPDLVLSLHGLVDVEAVAGIDSKDGGIRTTISKAPDAPLTKVIASFPGNKKGLIVNSRNLCSGPSRAEARMRGHNGRRHAARPLVQAGSCAGSVGGGDSPPRRSKRPPKASYSALVTIDELYPDRPDRG